MGTLLPAPEGHSNGSGSDSAGCSRRLSSSHPACQGGARGLRKWGFIVLLICVMVFPKLVPARALLPPHAGCSGGRGEPVCSRGTVTCLGSAASMQHLQRRRQAQREVTCSRPHSRSLAKRGPNCSLSGSRAACVEAPRSHWGDLRVPRALKSLCAQGSVLQPNSHAPRRQGSRHHSTELEGQRGPEG